jgi:hypothetical protein
MSKFAKFEQNLKRYYVFNIKYKNESWFMKFLAIFVRVFNKNFMTSYVSTIGNTIYFPSKKYIEKNEYAAMAVLAHEIVHVQQSEKYGSLLMGLAYLFPQCLALLSIGAVFAFLWLPMLWCLLFLLFLAPLPAPWRKKFELEGYTMSLFMTDLIMNQLGYTDQSIMTEMSVQAVRINKNQFKGSGYWFMWPFGVEDELVKKIEDIRKGVIEDTSEAYARVRRAYANAVSAYEL